MNRRLKDVFEGAKVIVVNKGQYSDTGNKYCEVVINGHKVGQRFNSYVDARCKGGYTDYFRTRLVVASDNFANGNKIQVYGIEFDLQERVSKAGEKYLAILNKQGKKIGYYINQKQRCTFNNICI